MKTSSQEIRSGPFGLASVSCAGPLKYSSIVVKARVKFAPSNDRGPGLVVVVLLLLVVLVLVEDVVVVVVVPVRVVVVFVVVSCASASISTVGLANCTGKVPATGRPSDARADPRSWPKLDGLLLMSTHVACTSAAFAGSSTMAYCTVQSPTSRRV